MPKREKAQPAPELPAHGGDKQESRFRTILTKLQQSGSVAVDDLSAELEVSVVTIRRDLDVLEQQGLLSRTHGGAMSIEPLFYEPFKKDRSFLAQVQRLADEKRRIVDSLVKRITVGKDEIDISLCYLPSFREMTNRQRMVTGSSRSPA